MWNAHCGINPSGKVRLKEIPKMIFQEFGLSNCDWKQLNLSHLHEIYVRDAGCVYVCMYSTSRTTYSQFMQPGSSVVETSTLNISADGYLIISVAVHVLWRAFYCYVAQVNCIVVKFPGDAFICPVRSVLDYPTPDKLTWQLWLNNHH